MTTRSFTLQTMTMEDAPRVGEIGKAAFLQDRHTMMKTGDNYDHEQAAQEPFIHWLSVPERVQCIKAVDHSGKILGYVCWGFRSYSKETIPTLNGRGLAAEKVEPEKMPGVSLQTNKTSGNEATKPAKDKLAERETTNGVDKIKRLESITNADMERWMAKLMPDGTKCMFICTLSVDPAYASEGTGSALMKWGTRIADEENVFCWVHASDGSHMFYEKHDFEKVGELTVDLDEFATRPAPDNEGIWGQYTFRYMKRLPIEDRTRY
jgi:N-acetylglutamate synthase-like GNAT family acetyltransferase